MEKKEKNPVHSLFELNQDNKRISIHTWVEILANQIDEINLGMQASSRDVLSSEMNLKINSQSYSAMQLGR